MNKKKQITVEKSKFIGLSFFINHKYEVLKILDDLKKQYKDATHICYAHKCFESLDLENILPNTPNFNFTQSYFDDNEPSGTAGQPILKAITNSGINNVLVVVVRYFGGIKLGTGGLSRAYSDAAAAVLDDNYKILSLHKGYAIECDYGQYSNLSKYAERFEFGIDDAEFLTKVKLNLFIPVDKSESHEKIIKKTLVDKMQYLGERYI